MEIIRLGTDDVSKLSARGCCWPPGTECMSLPAPEEAE